MIKNNVPEKYGTREEHIVYIKKLAVHLGYTPTRADISENELAIIKKHYTVWTQILTEAGLENFSSAYQQKLRRRALDARLRIFAENYRINPREYDMTEYIFLKNEYTQKKRHPAGFDIINAHSSNETIKAYLQALARELGYSPTIPVTYGANQILKRYKSWFAALKAAGLERSNTEEQTALRAKMNDRHFKQLLEELYDERIEKAE